MKKQEADKKEKFSLKVVETGKEFVQIENKDQLYVVVSILEDDKEVAVRRLGYSLDTDKETIENDLRKLLENYRAEVEFAEKQKEVDALYAKADATLAEIQNIEMSIDKE